MWVAEPLQRLRTLAALADAVEGLEGSRLISALDAATKHGEPAVSATVCGICLSLLHPGDYISSSRLPSDEIKTPMLSQSQAYFCVRMIGDLQKMLKDVRHSEQQLDEAHGKLMVVLILLVRRLRDA